MKPLLVDSLRVSAFGGVRSVLDLDLSATVTLIYAPNGTGKTSIVESIDWLYGGVTREQRCRFAKDDEPTEVSVSAMVGSKIISASRSLVNNKVVRLCNGVAVGELDLLQNLAPECDVSELAAPSQIARLKAYLSSNHVLGVDALARLIDVENADARADAMADLAGTRAQRNAQKVIELYGKRLAEKRSRLEVDLSNFRSLQEKFLDVSKDRGDVSALLLEAVKILAPDEGTGQTIDALTVFANTKSEEIKHRLSSLSELRSIQNFLLEKGGGMAPSDIDVLEKELQELRELSEKDSEIYRKAEQRIVDGIDATGRMDVLTDALLDLATTCEPSECLSDLFLIGKEVLGQFSTAKVANDHLLALTTACSQRHSQLAVLDVMSSQISYARSQLGIGPQEDQLVSDISHKEILIAESEKNRRALSALKAEAIRAATAAHAHEPGNSACPSCGFDWGTDIRLQQALQDALARMPQAENQFLEREDYLRTEVIDLQSLLARKRSNRSELDVREREFDLLRQKLDSENENARRFGFSSVEMVTSENVAEIRRRHAIAGRVKTIFDLGVETATLSAELLESTPANAAAIFSHRSRSGHNDIRDARDQLADLEVKASQRADEITRRTYLLKSEHGRRESVARLGERFESIREKLGLNLFTTAHLEAVQNGLEARQRQLEVALEHLRAAGDIQSTSTLVHEAERAFARIVRVNSDIEALDLEIARVRRVNAQIDDQTEGYRSRLIDAVGPSVSQLFQRMQVNRVFESVAMGRSFELHGLLGDVHLEPKLFSTGQRQDLALAFFLVRAFAMGGSFFLDEPLAHLDDVNRVAVLDTLRAFALSETNSSAQTRLVLTTASWTTTRHVIQKFMKVQGDRDVLRAYHLTGNVGTGIKKIEIAGKK